MEPDSLARGGNRTRQRHPIYDGADNLACRGQWNPQFSPRGQWNPTRHPIYGGVLGQSYDPRHP